ncbi:MAG TPA: hypothetical protein VFD92_21335 [Candidatus Binatia bacterium]|nr:hypothetical protein [Candidatus Binatia bacterium]
MKRQAGRAAFAAFALSSLLAFAPSAAREAQAQDWAGEQRWSVMPPVESEQPGVERAGTLRVVRFKFDGGDPMQDQGTVLGWANAAATGTLEPRREEQPEDALLEIVNHKPPTPGGALHGE